MSDLTSASGQKLIDVELVAADQRVWSGKASMVIVRTADGDLGVLPNHESVLAVLVPWPVTIRTPDQGDVVASVNGGFVSFADNRLSLLAESAELAGDIDVKKAERELALARDASDERAEAIAASRLAAAAGHAK